MNKKIYNKAYNKLVRRIIISSLLLLGVFFSKQFVTQYQINKEINTSHIMNVSGRQRMLSQKIVKDMAFIYKDDKLLNKDEYIKDLEESLELWEVSQEELLRENDIEDLSQKFNEIEPSFSNMLEGAEDFLQEISRESQDAEKVDLHFYKVVDNEEAFLNQMDYIVGYYEEDAINSVKRLRATHMFLFILILSILIFIGFRIFKPLLNYINNAFWRVNESNANLRNIFSTMKGALFVVKRDGQILFMNKDAGKKVIKEKDPKEKDPKEDLYLQTSIDWVAFDIMSLMEKVKKDSKRIEGIETTIKDRDGNLAVVLMSAVAGDYDGSQVVILNISNITDQKKAEEILKNTALKDELTGLYNRHFLDSIVDGEFDRAQRYDIPLSAMILDLDFFKRVNDKWGHPVGDTVLQFTADIVKDNIRSSDFAIRIGGEEFLVLMPNTDSKGALAAAEKIRQVIEKTAHSIVGHLTASFGVAERIDGEKYQFLYERVDQALYQAKENGRNRVVLAENKNIEQVKVPFKWNEKWNSGEALIDKQHQGLFTKVSDLVKASKGVDNREKIIQGLEELIEDVAEHFEYEESILKSIAYKDTYSHKKIHDDLLDKYRKTIKDTKMGIVDIEKAVNDIYDKLILGHLLCEDVKFFPAIKMQDE